MEKVRLGIIGVTGRGGIARYWAEDPRVEIVAGADPSEKSRGIFQKITPKPQYTQTTGKCLSEAT